MNILDLYSQDVAVKPLSVSGGREYRGPCPVCGGDDRFGVFPQQNNGQGSFFCGRAKGGGKGCGIGGDAIQYLIEVRKLSYRQACDYLGIEAKGGGRPSQYRYHLPETRKAQPRSFVPEEKVHPDEVVDPELWRKKGEEFIEKCHLALINRPMSIAYLLARGITKEGITRHKLGFFAGEERNGQSYQPSFRPRSSWGLSEMTNEQGKPARMMLPAGLIIPFFVDGKLHRITVRLLRPDAQNPKKKYHYLRGSIRDLFLTNPKAQAFVVIEAELDCIAVDCAAGDIVGTLGIGSNGVRPDSRAAKIAAAARCVLGAHDYDQAGASGHAWWQQTYPNYRRWPVPVGKDPGEAFQEGINLRQWILAGLPDFLLPQEAGSITEKPAAIPEQKKEERPLTDLYELKMLLREARGAIRVTDGGLNVSKEIARPWIYANPEKSGRISALINTSEAVGRHFAAAGDGVYTHYMIPG